MFNLRTSDGSKNSIEIQINNSINQTAIIIK